MHILIGVAVGLAALPILYGILYGSLWVFGLLLEMLGLNEEAHNGH